MATTYRTQQLQGTTGLATYGTLYNTSASATAVISTIAICNTASVSATYRIGIMGSAGTPSASEWIVFGASVAANDTVFITSGITLGNSRFIRVSSSANTVTFSAFVSEIT
jgi:hypothetical protein